MREGSVEYYYWWVGTTTTIPTRRLAKYAIDWDERPNKRFINVFNTTITRWQRAINDRY